ncbi:MAG TPA: peptidase, partial [Pirellulales bacterium]|nr:peptidase [Pirellulales bacterium]
MHRRTFLARTAATAGTLAATSAAAPLLLGAEDKAGTKNPIIGTGEYRYECLHDWGQLPKHLKWETTHGVTIDETGLIYIKHQGHGGAAMDTIVVFDPDGKFVRSFGKGYYPGGHGIDIRKEDGEEFLYLCDIAHCTVSKTNLKGELVWEFGYLKIPHVYKKFGEFKPTNVAFHPNGGFWVGDGYGSHYIHEFDKDARWVRTFGGAGKEPGKFQTPHGLWFDDRPGREPSLVIADRANARLQYMTIDSKPKSIINDVLFPAHFDIRGDVLLVPDLHARVSLFDRDNRVI